MEKKQIAEFYDNFVSSQEATGVNDRIYSLYKRMKKYGLNKHSNVLELGSGIGAMTYLLSKVVKKGKIEAVEISSKSVEYAKAKNKRSNVQFFNSDIVDYKPKLSAINFISLFDIIEHIPKERHFDLFKNISSYMNDDTILLINIPNPAYIEYDKKHNPEVLQVIDQAIYVDFLLQNLQENDLDIFYFEKYSIWVEDDYIFYAIEKKKEFKEHEIHQDRSLIEKALKKAFRLKLKLFYNYSNKKQKQN
jgi:trans-aconitate 2-methyltransferase